MMAIEMHNSVIKKSIHNWKCACRHEDFKQPLMARVWVFE